MNGQDNEVNPGISESRTFVLDIPIDSPQQEESLDISKGSWESNGRVPALEGPESNADDAIISASSFFFDNNDNYKVSWNEANERIAETNEDPSRPPVPGCNQDYIQWRLRRIIESIWFRALTMFLITFDICIVIADLVISNSTRDDAQSISNALGIVDFIITVYFALELTTRIIVLTPTVFFKAWYNMVDFAVVSITFICVCVARTGASEEWATKLTILTVLRFVRIVRLIRLCTERKQLETAARQLVSQNKRRYQVDGYDLDLTYITKRVIATSFPSSGLVALYRNPIRHLANFLTDKHGGKYKIYNLCSEKTYDESFFNGAKVERFRIDDHNVPTLEELFLFVENVANWLGQDPENVIVVHCKGGKGRTGTMICVWLIEKGIFSSAEESLDYFGNRRTDKNVSNKFQGVETPSQARYVGYFEKIKKNGGIFPEPRTITITEFRIKGMMFLGKGDGSDFWLDINEGCGPGSHQFSAHIGFNRNCNPEYDPVTDQLIVRLVNCPSLEGDVRVLFQTDNPDIPKGYENAPFYFWFNTRMIQGNSLTLNRSQLDNPHKEKTWKYFREHFRIEVIFT